jgi:F-type H+-transporting ATPase subunit gamma
MAENHNRLQHLEGAVNHLDDETVNLNRKLQIYRQEEITEEIEVILLNSDIWMSWMLTSATTLAVFLMPN